LGVLLSALSFARKVAQVLRVTGSYDADTETRTYEVRGQVFFASAPAFLGSFDFKEAVARVRIDVSHAHVLGPDRSGRVGQGGLEVPT